MIALTKLSETTTTLTLGWTPPAGIGGYVFYANGVAVSTGSPNLKSGSPRNSVKFSKTEPGPPFQVAAVCNQGGILLLEVGTYADEPPPAEWPANFFTGPAGQKIILPPRQGVLSGIWDSGWPGTDGIKRREAQVGRLFDLGAGSYSTGTTANSDGKLTKIVQEGRIPICSMHSNKTIAEVNAGAEDAWHRACARAVAALGTPCFVRLFHEFNGEWMRYYTAGDTAASGQPFRDAWRRVVSIWKSETDLASFVWHYAQSNGLNAYHRYPGEEWVDWTANSNYTYAAQQWVGFYQDYADLWQLLGWAREYKVSDPARYNNLAYKPLVDCFGKPHMLGEWGHFEDSRKAQWLRDAKANLLGTLETKQNGGFPNVLGMLYSDYGQEADPNGQAWTLDKPANGIDGFRELVNDSYFNTYDR